MEEHFSVYPAPDRLFIGQFSCHQQYGNPRVWIPSYHVKYHDALWIFRSVPSEDGGGQIWTQRAAEAHCGTDCGGEGFADFRSSRRPHPVRAVSGGSRSVIYPSCDEGWKLTRDAISAVECVFMEQTKSDKGLVLTETQLFG